MFLKWGNVGFIRRLCPEPPRGINPALPVLPSPIRYHHSMSEADSIALSTRGPVTKKWLVDDLRALGVREGMLLMVHTSLSKLGWVIGGAHTVIAALREVVGESGTIVMPGFSRHITEPSYWQKPPVPEEWWQTIRDEAPAYDERTVMPHGMGVVPLCFQLHEGVKRSAHPSSGWLAQGPLAKELTADHRLDMEHVEDSPKGYCYRTGAYVLSLATQRTTILHFAENLTDYPGREIRHVGTTMLVDGERRWVEYDDLEGDDEDFEQIRQEFMASHPAGPDTWSARDVAYGGSRLFKVKPLVDFACGWIKANRN